MSVGAFIWKACWREAGTIARSVNVILVTLPALAAIVIGGFGGTWSKNFWPWWVWVAIIAADAICVVFFALARRAYVLERELEPRIAISSTSVVDPRGATKGLRTVRIEVENISRSTLKNCRVREAFFINRFQQASGMRRHFRLSEETYADMGKHTYRKSFDLQGFGSREIIDIAQLDETKPDTRVVMLFATDPTAQTLNAILRDCFPHRLTISVTADNLPTSIERTYDLQINSDGVLQIIPVAD